YKGQVLAQVCERTPPSMTERLRELGSQESIPLVVEDSVASCLAKDPAKRPQTVREVLRLLERSEVPAPVVPASSPRGEEVPRETGPNLGGPASLPARSARRPAAGRDAGAPRLNDDAVATVPVGGETSEARSD